MTTIAALRELLNKKPGIDLRKELFKLLEDADASDQAMLVDYANGHISHWPPDYLVTSARITMNPTLGRLVRKVSFQESLGGLLEADHLTEVVILELYRMAFDISMAEQLAACTQFSRVQSLLFGGCRMDGEIFAAFASTHCFPALTSLSLSYNQLDAVGIKALVQAPFFSQLTELNLADNGLTDDAIQPLLECIEDCQLRALSLPKNKLGRDAMARFKDATHLSGLQRLDLSHNPLHDDGVLLFLEATHLSRLQELALKNVSCSTDDTLGALLDVKHFQELKSLDIGHNWSGGQLTSWLPVARSLPALGTLRIEGASLSHDDIYAMQKGAMKGVFVSF